MIRGQVFPTVREAIHHTVTRAEQPMKEIAAHLDWSPSELSMRTALGGDSARAFPADDDHLIRVMAYTGDYSPVLTMAAKLGLDVRPRVVDVGRVVEVVRADLRRVEQMLLDLKPPRGAK